MSIMISPSKKTKALCLLLSVALTTNVIKASHQRRSNSAFLHNSWKRNNAIPSIMSPYSYPKRSGIWTKKQSTLYMAILDKNNNNVDVSSLNSANMNDNESTTNIDLDREIIDTTNDKNAAVMRRDDIEAEDGNNEKNMTQPVQSFFEKLLSSIESSFTKLPPLIVEDTSVLFYDVFLLINLSLSISFWVVHRMSFEYIGTALSEGSLLCIIWIISGLYNGAFLLSAVDGHYGSDSEEGGPKAAGMLGLSTFVTTANIRIVVALIMALIEHRPVGSMDGEMLMPSEILFGIALMSLWRSLHSYYTPRI